MRSLQVLAVATVLAGGAAGCFGEDDRPRTIELTAVYTEGDGCTTDPTLVAVLTDMFSDAGTIAQGGDTGACGQVFEDDGEWQVSCTFVAGTGPDAFVEHVRIAVDGVGGVLLPTRGVPPCTDVYTITSRVDR